MSEAQQTIAKHYENICKDLGQDPMELVRNRNIYKTVRDLVYDYQYDFGTIEDAGLDEEELQILKEQYSRNKYESIFLTYKNL